MITLLWFFIMKYGFNYPFTLEAISYILFHGLVFLAIEIIAILGIYNTTKE